jgi:hypothetical protein
MSKDIIIPSIIIIFCFIFIYGILKNQQDNKLIKAFENFSDMSSISKKNMITNNFFNNLSMLSKIGNGTWTSFNTTVDSNYNVNNLTTINILSQNINDSSLTLNNNNIQLGTIQTYIPENPNELTQFNITNVLNGILIGNSNDKEYNIEIKFLSLFKNEDKYFNYIYPTNTPMAIISLYSLDTLVKRYMTFKVYDNKVGAELYRIVVSQNFDVVDPPKIYNFDTYNRIVHSYVFPNNFMSFIFGQTNDNVLNTIRNNYFGRLKFSIKRVFKSPNGNTFSTKISRPITLDPISNGQIPQSIEIVSFQNDNNLNNFQGTYKPYQTMLYFYKFQNVQTNYNYANPNISQRNKSVFKLQNQANNMFNDNIQFNKLNTVTQYNNYIFDIVLLTTVDSDYLNSTIIPFSTIFPFL